MNWLYKSLDFIVRFYVYLLPIRPLYSVMCVFYIIISLLTSKCIYLFYIGLFICYINSAYHEFVSFFFLYRFKFNRKSRKAMCFIHKCDLQQIIVMMMILFSTFIIWAKQYIWTKKKRFFFHYSICVIIEEKCTLKWPRRWMNW